MKTPMFRGLHPVKRYRIRKQHCLVIRGQRRCFATKAAAQRAKRGAR